MTPLRAEEITLFCEDKHHGRSQKILDAAVSELAKVLPFARAVRAVGVSNKSDVVVRAKFARTQKDPALRVLAVRDRDFLTRPLVADARARVFDDDPQRVLAWPLSRHSIESYLLDDDVLVAISPEGSLRETIARAAAARKWLDVARGTLDDLAYRLRRVRQKDINEPPIDRETAIATARAIAAEMESELAAPGALEALTRHVDALAADMEADGPLEHRVDGRELLYDVERAMGRGRGSLLDTLSRQARKAPPATLVADLRAVLQAMPPRWQAYGD